MTDETSFTDPQSTRAAAGQMRDAGEAIEDAFRKYGPLIESLSNPQTYGDDDPGREFAGSGGEGFDANTTNFLTDAPKAGEAIRLTGEAVQGTVDIVTGADKVGKDAINNTVRRT